MRRAFLVFVAALTLTACQVDTSVEVEVEADGSGTITVNATADADVVAQAPGLAEDLRFDDAVAAGWILQGPIVTDVGGLSVTLSHDFATVEEATVLLASVNGSGGPLRDVTVTRNVTDDEMTTSLAGTLRIDGGVDAFADPEMLAAIDGSALRRQHRRHRPAPHRRRHLHVHRRTARRVGHHRHRTRVQTASRHSFGRCPSTAPRSMSPAPSCCPRGGRQFVGHGGRHRPGGVGGVVPARRRVHRLRGECPPPQGPAPRQAPTG